MQGNMKQVRMDGLIALQKSYYPTIKKILQKRCPCGALFTGKSERCKPCRAEFIK